MARATATFTATDTDNYRKPPRNMRENKFLADVLQNIEFLAQTHDHSGDAGDGGALWYVQPLRAIGYWGGAF